MPHTDPEVSMLRNMYNCTKQTSIFLLTHNSRNIGAGYPIRRTMRLMEVNEQKYVFDAFVKCTDHACGFFYYYYFTDNSKSLSNRERYWCLKLSVHAEQLFFPWSKWTHDFPACCVISCFRTHPRKDAPQHCLALWNWCPVKKEQKLTPVYKTHHSADSEGWSKEVRHDAQNQTAIHRDVCVCVCVCSCGKRTSARWRRFAAWRSRSRSKTTGSGSWRRRCALCARSATWRARVSAEQPETKTTSTTETHRKVSVRFPRVRKLFKCIYVASYVFLASFCGHRCELWTLWHTVAPAVACHNSWRKCWLTEC